MQPNDEKPNNYAAAIAELAEATHQLLDQFLQLGDLTAHSEAMAELAAESDLVSQRPPGRDNPWGNSPVRTAQSVAQTNVILAQDFGRSFLLLASGDADRIIFGFAPAARAALENLARARWLFEPGIGVRRRVGRGMNDRLEGLRQQSRLNLGDSRRKSNRRIKSIIAQATDLGFTIVVDPRGRDWIEEPRPSSTQLMRQLFIDPKIGAPTYSFLSGIAHGLPASLSPFMVQAERDNDPLAVWEQRTAVLDAHTTNLVAGLMVMGVVPVLEDQHRYLGVTPDPEMQQVGRRAISLVDLSFSE